MATWIYSYGIYMLVIGSSLSTRCPLNVNDRVNITRTHVAIPFLRWYSDDAPLTAAVFNESERTCKIPSEKENYTIYCEAGGKFTLEVHHPVEGDIYRDDRNPNITTSIIFQEPKTIRLVITPPLNTNITLIDDETYNLTTTINCTKPTPVLQWIVRTMSGTDITINGNSTTDKTGCDVKQTTVTSIIAISKQTVSLFNQPFQVLSQLSYTVCDNIHTSLPTGYITITETPQVTTDTLNNTVDEGVDVMFNCSVDRLEPSSITWTRSQQGGQLYSGALYNLRDVTCQNTDNYTCSANNTVDKFLSRSVPLYVKCSPREISQTRTPRIITNTVGTEVTLQVDVIAYPAPIFTWYHRRTDQRLTTVVDEQLTINQYKSTLTITLNSSLFGDYVVSVVNDVGKINFTFVVTEGVPTTTPGPTKDNSILIAVGAAAGVLVVLIIGIIICICVYRKQKKGKKKTNADSPSIRAQPQDSDTEVYFDNPDYVGSDHIFGPRTGAPATGIFGDGKDGGNRATNTLVYDDNVAYLGSDHIFGPRTGTNGTTNNTPAQSQEPTQGQIYAQVDRTKKRPATSTKPAQQKQKPVSTSRGLNYTQVDFTNNQPATSKKPAKPKVARVEYAGIQHGVKGHIQRPDEDDDDE